MTLMTRLAVALATVAWTACAFGQSTLGAVVDAGAKPLTPEDFKQQVMQRILVGPTATGGSLEYIYAGNGMIEGRGMVHQQGGPQPRVEGQWKFDDSGRVCTTMIVYAAPGASTAGFNLGMRCQHWYRLGADYFIADSDTDRSAKVLRRSIKQ